VLQLIILLAFDTGSYIRGTCIGSYVANRETVLPNDDVISLSQYLQGRFFFIGRSAGMIYPDIPIIIRIIIPSIGGRFWKLQVCYTVVCTVFSIVICNRSLYPTVPDDSAGAVMEIYNLC